MGQAFTLLISGMITIFVVLSLVVLVGNLLINLANRWAPERPTPSRDLPPASEPQLAAIVAAVEIMTKGKGKILEITKEN